MHPSTQLASVTGRVHSGGGDDDARSGGLPGVMVTDGLAVTRTDAGGRYQLLIDPDRRHTALIYITVPAGWRAPISNVRTPVFYQHVEVSAGTGAHADFTLFRDRTAEDAEYRFAGLTDVHVEEGAVNTREKYRRQLEGINRLSQQLDGTGPPRFAIIAGDLTNYGTPSEFQDYRSATAASDVPVWSAPGNHDFTGYARGGPNPRPASAASYRDVIDGYRLALGPEWYSFEYGPHHFVILENFRGLREPDQLTWLEQDLKLNAGGKQVVIVTHVPWNVPQTPVDDISVPYLELLADYDVRLFLAGHTHSNDVTANVVGDALQVVTTSAVSTLDQTPQGFRMVEFRDGVRAPYYEYDASRSLTVVHPVGAVAGHSVGEITAAAGARVITAEQAMVFVRERGRAMAQAASATPTGMTAVLGGDTDDVLRVLEKHGLTPANVNGAGQIVAAGTLQQLEALKEDPPDGARLRPLSVAGAFHTQHMAPAVDVLRRHARAMTTRDPRSRLLSNRDGHVIHDGREVLNRITEQVSNPVRWDLCQATMVDLGVTGLLEMPPAGTLTGLAKRAIPGVETFALKTPDQLDEARQFVERHGAPSPLTDSPTWRLVVAPMKGTFTAAPFEVGAQLAPGDTIGTVNSLRDSQDVSARHGGTVLEWLVEDGDPVAPGQPLVRLHPEAVA